MLSVRQLTPTESYAVRRSLSVSSSPLPGSDQDAARQLMEMIQSIIDCRLPALAARPTIRLPGQEVPGFPHAVRRGTDSSLTRTFCTAAMAFSVYGAAEHVAAVAAAGADRCVRSCNAQSGPLSPWPVG